MDEKVRAILKHSHINMTHARKVMLELFLQTNEALALHNFLKNPSIHLDRTTIFRTLKLFVDKRILLCIRSVDGLNRYLMLDTTNTTNSIFICKNCKKILPLELIVKPKLKRPPGFKFQTTDIIVEGLCESCRN